MQADQPLLYVIIAVVLFFLLVSIRRRREGIHHALRRAIIVEAVYFGVVLILVQAGRTPLEALLAGIVAALIVNQTLPGRSRYIPASVKRQARAEFELRTGKKFNPRKHEYDHEIAFSKGGSNTEDNIRVVEKRRNRAKGGKSPWWDLLGR